MVCCVDWAALVTPLRLPCLFAVCSPMGIRAVLSMTPDSPCLAALIKRDPRPVSRALLCRCGASSSGLLYEAAVGAA